MAAWSLLTRSAEQSLQNIRRFRHKLIPKNIIGINNAICLNPTRKMSSEMYITASRWHWHKTKDTLHFYFFLMAIPLGIITFCANVFIGPATLTEIPEDYHPHHWEYYRHPVTRFFARYFFQNPQKNYEKMIYGSTLKYRKHSKSTIKKAKKLNWETQDVRVFNFKAYDAHAHRHYRELAKEADKY